MTVAELIEELKEKDADAVVYIGIEGELYPASSHVMNVFDWRKIPTGDVAIVGD